MFATHYQVTKPLQPFIYLFNHMYVHKSHDETTETSHLHSEDDISLPVVQIARVISYN